MWIICYEKQLQKLHPYDKIRLLDNDKKITIIVTPDFQGVSNLN
jgi:hypothetical protein